VDILSIIDDLSAVRRAEMPDSEKADWGQYFTSSVVAAFMASLSEPLPGRRVRILDPGAGTGILGAAASIAAFASGAAEVELVAVEAEPQTTSALQRAIDYLSQSYGERFHAQVVHEDFLDLGQPTLRRSVPEAFDLAISNPPYFKMSPSKVQGGDAPNAYARFMEVSASLLRQEGLLVFIVPRSYTSGLYFRGFRRRFHEKMALERVHVFDSRREAFRVDDVLQENIIVRYRKARPSGHEVEVSSSDSPASLADVKTMRVPRSLMFPAGSPSSQVLVPASAEQVETVRLVRSWSASLRSLGLRISTGPVVPFRATDLLVDTPNGQEVAPLLWMQHVQAGKVRWPLVGGMRKPEYILASAGEKLLVQNSTYVLLRRFSAKEEARRLTAAVLDEDLLPGERIGLENHLNFIHRPGGKLTREEALGLAAVLSSSIVDDYFRVANGNTQVNATDIEAMPFPEPRVIWLIGSALVDRDQGFIACRAEMDQLLLAALQIVGRSGGPRKEEPRETGRAYSG
jgi:adenine-specific DNA-methyltransferase